MVISTGISLGELERLLQKRRREVDSLTRKRTKIEKRLRALDEKIRLASGTGPTTRSGRARNELTLVEAIDGAFKGTAKPLKVGEIMERVLASGYQSTSANFRGIVNQTLIKGKQFYSSERGVYALKR
jgi:hypothetical protein